MSREEGRGERDHVIGSSRERYNRPPLGAERQRLDVNQKSLHRTQAGHCWLFTGLHLSALYHSIRTAFTLNTTEKRPSIKLKTSHWPWRGRRKGTRGCPPHPPPPYTFIFPTCCCPLRGRGGGMGGGWRSTASRAEEAPLHVRYHVCVYEAEGMRREWVRG